MIKNLITQYKLLIYPVTVGLASLILIIFVIAPQLQEFLTVQQNLNKTQTRLDNLSIKVSALENFDQNAYRDKLLAALYALPVDRDYSAVVGIFQELAASAGMSLGSLELSGTAEGNSYSVEAEVIGPITSLGNLLDVIEKNPRVMRLSTLETTPSETGLVSASFGVNVFYSSAPKTLGPVDAPLPELTQKDQELLDSLSLSGRSAIGAPLPTGKSNPFE